MDVKDQDIILQDFSKTGRERPWKEKKVANYYLSLAYEMLGTEDENFKAKAVRLKECGSWLEFSLMENGAKKLHKANFCRVRLCPICSWRRSLKIFDHTRRIMLGMKSEKDYAYIFLTLTVKNCQGQELHDEITHLMESWNRFSHCKPFADAVKGWYRGLEVTHNVKPNNSHFDTFHPHFHCVLAVNKSYFSSKNYLNRSQWQKLWKSAAKVDYLPQVDVRKIKGDTAEAVAEVAKYTVKDSDYIIPNDWDLTMETVKILDDALARRRLVAYGGKFAEWHKRLNLDDEMDGDLVNIDSAVLPEDEQKLINYVWHVGYQQYIAKFD